MNGCDKLAILRGELGTGADILRDVDKAVDDVFVLQAEENPDFADGLQGSIKPQKAADEKVADEAVKFPGQGKDLLRPLALGVSTLIGEKLLRTYWARPKY